MLPPRLVLTVDDDDLRLAEVLAGARLDVVDEGDHAGLDPVDHRLRIDAGEDDDPDERQQRQPLLAAELTERAVVLVDLAVEHALVGPQEVERGEDHAGGGDDRPPARRPERAEEHEELADESVESGNADRRQHHDGESGGEHRGDLLDAAQVGDLAGVATLVDPSDEDEEGAGGDAVVDHLQHAAGDRLRRQGERAEDDEAEVGDRRVGDEAFEVASASSPRSPRR